MRAAGECWRCGAGTPIRSSHAPWCDWLIPIRLPLTGSFGGAPVNWSVRWIVNPQWPGYAPSKSSVLPEV